MHKGSETREKFVDGLSVVPSAGPMFDKHEILAVTASPRSSPRELAMVLDIIARII